MCIAFQDLKKLIHNFRNTYKLYSAINEKYKKNHKSLRKPNFPSEISENICAYAIQAIYGYIPCWNRKQSGDLFYDGKRIEVKAFNSKGPCSFGPTENWDIIYFVDCTLFDRGHMGHYIVYEINLKNTSNEWKTLLVNNTTTFADVVKTGKRPRQTFEKIRAHLGDNCVNIFNGTWIF